VLQILKLLKALNANRRPGEMALGLAFGVWLALVPVDSLTGFSIFALFFVLKVNLGSGLVMFVLFSPFHGLVDPLLDGIGYTLLTDPSYQGFQTFAANMPLATLWGLSRTLVTGGLLVGFLAFLPLSGIFLGLVLAYRRFIQPIIFENPVTKAILRLPIVQKIVTWYRRISHIAG